MSHNEADDIDVQCGACEVETSLAEAVEAGWFPDVELNDGTDSGMHLCPDCAVRLLDAENRLPIQTYVTICNIRFGLKTV
jgi:hypothetical protein